LFDGKIVAVQSDWGGKYGKLNSFFTKIEISHHVSCPHSYQQNGSAKRKYCHIVEVGLSLLAHATLPLKFWDEAFLAITYLINCTPSKVIDYQTPLDRLYKINPNYYSLRIFGCARWPNLRPYNPQKLASDPKNVLSSAIATYTNGSNALIYPHGTFTYLET
jgi:hypothetical protein